MTCTVCGHFRGSHASSGCTVQHVSGPPADNRRPSDILAHTGRDVTRCPCTGFVQPERNGEVLET